MSPWKEDCSTLYDGPRGLQEEVSGWTCGVRTDSFWHTFTIGCNLWPSIEGQLALVLDSHTLLCGGVGLEGLIQRLVELRLAMDLTISLIVGLIVDLTIDLTVDLTINLSIKL